MNYSGMKPVYYYDKVNNVCEVLFETQKYILDTEDVFKIINLDKTFKFYDINENYPSYKVGNNNITLIEYIYGVNLKNKTFNYINHNINDLTRKNIEVINKYNTNIDELTNILLEKYEEVKLLSEGHIITRGKEANKVKNQLWEIKIGEDKLLIMHCGNNTFCKLCPESYKKILDYEKYHNNGNKLTFYINSTGYILSNSSLYIHQIITGCHGNGKGTKNISVDHIDRDPLNNCLNNLKVASRKEQEQNCNGIMDGTKRNRKHSAKPLPEGLSQDMMKKYVVYYHEWLNPEKTRSREFFKIEKHPKLLKPYVGTKSNKVSILDKLKLINKIAEDLDNDIYPEKMNG
jgi:hypothetical protein